MASCVETLLRLVRQEAQVAVGCTEPAMVALAAAAARALAGEPPVRIEVSASPGVLKNARAVGLPGTRRKGIDMAAALGAVGGDAGLGLRVLEPVTPEDAAAAAALVESGCVRVRREAEAGGLMARVEVVTAGHRAAVTISESHTNFVRTTLDGRDVAPFPEGGRPSDKPGGDRSSLAELTRFRFADLYEAVMMAGLDDIVYLVEGAESNYDLARAALQGECLEAAPDYTRSLKKAAGGQVLGPDLVSQVRLLTAAAVSARMGGTPWPVLTSGGSGNQGILVGLPVLLVARHVAAEAGGAAGGPERLTRALLLAHAVNLYLKAFCGELSAVCGTVTGGAGVAAATCWLLGGDRAQGERAIQMVASGLYATICDGAKGSCALKIAEGAANGVIAGQLARDGGFVEPGEGLVGKDIDETVRLLGRLTREVINGADRLMTPAD